MIFSKLEDSSAEEKGKSGSISSRSQSDLLQFHISKIPFKMKMEEDNILYVVAVLLACYITYAEIRNF